ncbi:MAG: carbon starvation CstA 5TM domain-containing protein, partial [Chthoniobacteraceae bacterium]
AWGFFLIMGVRDPDGGVKALWPIFGIANQLLASIALCLATTILLKMQLARKRPPALVFVTLIPLAWLLTVTITAGVTKVWDANPKIGFLAAARAAEGKIPALEQTAAAADTTALPAAEKAVKIQRTIRFNNTVDAWVTGIFLTLVSGIVVLSFAEWLKLLGGSREPKLSETEPVWLPADALGSARPVNVFGAAALAFTMLKEVSGQADLDRAQQHAETCNREQARTPRGRQNVFLTATEHRFTGIRRCC